MLSVSGKKLCNKTMKSSTSTVGNSSDLLMSILYLLPAKLLCQFKTVSKHWLSLISDPYFETNYNRQSCRIRMPALFMKKILTRESQFETLVIDERNGIYYVPFSNPIDVNHKKHIIFEQSCNGLVICQVLDEPTYVIYNPYTKHSKTIPSPPFRGAPDICMPQVLSVTIAFDPAKSSYYQVVGVYRVDIRKDVLRIEIYSSKTDSWRDAGDPFPFSSPVRLRQSGVYWNGSVHWIDQWTGTLHYFDIECELMKTAAMPEPSYSGRNYSKDIVYFGECMGHMHLMLLLEDGIPRFDIWEMQMDYSGWNVKYHIDPSILVKTTGEFFHRSLFHVLLIEEGEDSSRLIIRISNVKVVSFDLNNQSFKEMYDVNPSVHVHGFQYVEALSHA